MYELYLIARGRPDTYGIRHSETKERLLDYEGTYMQMITILAQINL